MRIKNFISFVNEGEMSVRELETLDLVPNYKCIKDWKVDGETFANNGDLLYYDDGGKRFVIIQGNQERMIVDRDVTRMKDHFEKIEEKEINESTLNVDSLPSTFSKNVGFTTVMIKNGILAISHGGNMGDTVEHSVNPNLKIVGLPTIESLKQKFELIDEKGSPDYWYNIRFKLKKTANVKSTNEGEKQENDRELVSYIQDAWAELNLFNTLIDEGYVKVTAAGTAGAEWTIDNVKDLPEEAGKRFKNMKDAKGWLSSINGMVCDFALNVNNNK